MDGRLLHQADAILSKCGRPMMPEGASVVYFPKSFLVQSVVPTASQTVIQKEISGEVTWCLRAISSTISTTTALYVQIQLPNGKFLINQLMDVTQIAGYGSYRYLFSKELPCPPGSKVQVTFDTSLPAAGSAQPIVMLFEGAYAFHLRSSRRHHSLEEYASELPRYLATTGQNILAPCWMSGEGPRIPECMDAQRYIYSVPSVSITVGGPALAASAQIQIEQGADFECRRLLVDVTADTLVTAGSILLRARLASGYQLMDDYLNAALYIGSSLFAKYWHCPAGDSVVIDFLLVDGAGTGDVSCQVHLDGEKRWRKAA